MPDNTSLLRARIRTGPVGIHPSPLLWSAPVPPFDYVDFDRVEGMLVGLAIGDSLGTTSEGMLPAHRREEYGEIRDYLPNHCAGGRCVGLPSDDSQLAFWTLEQLLADDGLIPGHVADRFCRKQIFGIRNTVRECLSESVVRR